MQQLMILVLAAITICWPAGRVSGQTPQTCWVSVAENVTGLTGIEYTRPARATEAGGGELVLLSLRQSLVAYSVAQGRVAWRFAWQPLTEVMADGDVFSYPIRQDGACPLALDESAGLVYLGAGDRVLYALELATGRQRWSWRSSQAFESVVCGGGRVLASTEDYRQVGLDGASGQLVWQLQFRRLSSPQTGVFEGVLVRPEQSGSLWGINSTSGQVMWLKAPLRRAPIVNFFDAMPYDPDTGLFFVSDDAGWLYALQLRTGAVAWEADVASQQSNKRLSNVAAANGRVFAVSGVTPPGDPGPNAHAVALNASTGAVLWEQSGLGSCGPGGMQVLPQRGAVLLGLTSSWGGATPPIQYTAADETTGATLWTLPMGGRFCASTPQYLPGSDMLLLATLSEDRTALELTTLPAALGRTCPQRPAEQDTDAGASTPPSPPLTPPAPPPPPPEAAGPADYCWRAQLSQLPLADPATDGERVYAQDNRGMAIAVDVRTGAVAWKSAACGLDAIWPGSPLVSGGVVYLICATSRVLALNATTGRLLWRTRPICQNYLKPDRTCTPFGSYGHPDISRDLGLVYFGGPDRSYYAFNITTGEEVWNYYEDNTLATYGSSVGLLDGVLYAVAIADNGVDMKLLALNATDGMLVWSRLADGATRDNGVLQFVNGTLAVGTSSGELRLFSVGLEGGDMVWSMPATSNPISGVERHGDTLYFGDADGWVRAVSISRTALLWEVSTMDLPELEGLPVPINVIQPRPVYSQGRLYVTCVAGLLVMDAATGKVLWADLSQRSLASPLVIERPEGAQVVIGQYLDKLVSISPNCNAAGRGATTLAFLNSPPPPPRPSPPSPPSSPPSPLTMDPPPPTPPPASFPPPATSSPASVPSLAPAVNATTCPVCPLPAAKCHAVPSPTGNSHRLRVSLGLSGVSAKALKADSKAQAGLAAAVDKVAGGSGVRVEVESVSSPGGGSSGALAVVRLRVEVQGGSGRVADVVGALEASMLEGRGSSVGGSSKLPVSTMQAALAVAAVSGRGQQQALAAARVRTLVVVRDE